MSFNIGDIVIAIDDHGVGPDALIKNKQYRVKSGYKPTNNCVSVEDLVTGRIGEYFPRRFKLVESETDHNQAYLNFKHMALIIVKKDGVFSASTKYSDVSKEDLDNKIIKVIEAYKNKGEILVSYFTRDSIFKADTKLVLSEYLPDSVTNTDVTI